MPALLLAAAIGVMTLAVAPHTADLAAQTYRADLFDRVGFTLWDNGWYAGHHMPGYSLLFPPLGGWIGARALGALALVAATAGFVRLIRGRRASGPAAVWFAAALGAALISGRIPFILGAAFAVWTAVAAMGGRRGAAAVLGFATATSSPVAALFLAFMGAAIWWHDRNGDAEARARGAAWLAAAITATIVMTALVVAFPEGGSEPFVPSSFWPALAGTIIALCVVPKGPWRTGAGLYALLLIAAFAISSPLGGNAGRLGALLAGPLALLVLAPKRRWLLAAALLPLAWWTLYPAGRDWIDAFGDPSTNASYYAPLLAELSSVAGPADRIEIPFTARHWEAAHVASRFAIARGWERQFDRKVNDVFYEGQLTPARFERWLRETAVRFVAVPDARLDHSSTAEARIARARQPFLREIWRSAHWRLYEVRNARPTGATRITADGFTTNGGGTVRVRFTPYWKVVRGTGCVERADGGWTRIIASGPVEVAARFSFGRIVTRGKRCSS